MWEQRHEGLSENSSEVWLYLTTKDRQNPCLSSTRAFKNLIEIPNWDTNTLENKTMVLKVSPRLQRDTGFQLWKRGKICILIFLSPPSKPFQVASSSTFQV